MITVNIDILRTKSEEFKGTPEDLENIVTILDYELANSPNGKGAGLSAIQTNMPLRVAIIRTKLTNLTLYNAKIIRAEQPFVFKGEGCLSFPGKFITTNRYNLIEIENGDGKNYKFSGFEAVLIQHELGHWDGDLFIDHEASIEQQIKSGEVKK